MMKWFKKYFIPHEHNDFKPHFLRGEMTLFILGIVLAGELFFLAEIIIFPKLNYTAEVLPSVIVENTNEKRLALNMQQLQRNSILENAATQKAKDMAEKGYFSHVSPDGTEPWFWFDNAGYDYSYAGENLAVNFFDSYDVVEAWMNSVKHKENILNGNFTEIGIGIAKGMYQGKETIFVVQLFGRPASHLGDSAPVSKTLEKTTALPIASTKPPRKSTSTDAVAGVQSFVSIDKEKNIISSSSEVIPVGIKEIAKTTFMGRIISSPRQALNYLYGVLFTIVLFALFLKIFIKINIQHPPLIINGAMMLIFMGFAMVIHKYISLYQGSVF